MAATFQKMVVAHRATLARLCERWGPETHPEVNEALDNLAQALIAELRVMREDDIARTIGAKHPLNNEDKDGGNHRGSRSAARAAQWL